MFKQIKTFTRSEEGQGLVEYGLILSGIALVVFVAVQSFGIAVLDLYVNAIETIGWK